MRREKIPTTQPEENPRGSGKIPSRSPHKSLHASPRKSPHKSPLPIQINPKQIPTQIPSQIHACHPGAVLVYFCAVWVRPVSVHEPVLAASRITRSAALNISRIWEATEKRPRTVWRHLAPGCLMSSSTSDNHCQEINFHDVGKSPQDPCQIPTAAGSG